MQRAGLPSNITPADAKKSHPCLWNCRGRKKGISERNESDWNTRESRHEENRKVLKRIIGKSLT